MEFTPVTRELTGERVTYTRRFFGDSWLEAILQVCTLGIGWFIWFFIVAPRGQTPAKQLLHVYIHDNETGQVATAGRVWMREFVAKNAAVWLLTLAGYLIFDSTSFGLGNIYYIIGALMVFSEGGRALWDRIAGTVVRYHPDGVNAPSRTAEQQFGVSSSAAITPEARLRELDRMAARGLITTDEYEAKRKEILGSL